MDIIFSMILDKFIDLPLFTMCVIICIQASNLDVFDQEESSPFAMY